MKYTDLIDIDDYTLNKMSKEDLKTVVSKLSSVANKRIKRLSASDIGREAPAYKSYEKRGSKFSVKNKNINQLRNEYASVRNFLNFETSTTKGWSKVRKEVYSRIGGDFSSTPISEKDFWKAYRKLEETNALDFLVYGSTEIQRRLRAYIEHAELTDVDALVDHVSSVLNKSYESEQEDNDAFPDFDEE